MYEDHTIEEKYLYNFSFKEKEAFYRQQRSREKQRAKYEKEVKKFFSSDSETIFGDWGPEKSTSLEVKYVLNRISANDPKDTAFELSGTDEVSNADQLAVQLAKSFRKNTSCKRVVLHGIGLTDKGMLPILSVLRHKELALLDVSENNITDRSLRAIERVLSDPNTHWEQMRLGKIRLTPNQNESLAKHPNLSFELEIPSTERPNEKFNGIFSRIRGKFFGR